MGQDAGGIDAAQWRGLARLAVDGVVRVSEVAEAMHVAIARSATPRGAPVPAPGRVSGWVYGSVRSVARGIGRLLPSPEAEAATAPPGTGARTAAWLSALNAVAGDHLEHSGNPLSVPMSLRIDGRPWRDALQTPRGRIVVLVHGLAMTDLQWRRRGHDHGQALARDEGFTPVYLRYNTGLPVAENGRRFGERLDELVEQWPVRVDELVLIGHSMGGLVARSAVLQGEGRRWRAMLSAVVCLGSPHHGAPLERLGRAAESLLSLSPHAAPLARLGADRSAGIRDLGAGGVLPPDEASVPDWPSELPCHRMAATVSRTKARWLDASLGDGLVPVRSALGDPSSGVRPGDGQVVLRGAHHWDLLDRPEAYEAIREWLSHRRRAGR